jgi:heat shock factor-binding protein 1
LKQMQDRFDEMQGTIVQRIDDMGMIIIIWKGKRIDDIEKSVTDLMNDLGLSDDENDKQRWIKNVIL